MDIFKSSSGRNIAMSHNNVFIFFIIISCLKVFGQSQDTAQSIQQNTQSATTVNAVYNPVEDEKAQKVSRRYMDYTSWYYDNVYPLAKLAEEKGINATPEEIAAQEKAFTTMFPGIWSNPNDLRNEIIARKYSKTLHGSSVSQGNVQYAYAHLQSEFPNEPLPQFADVRPMLEMKALLENRSVQIEVENCIEQFQKKQNESLIKASETWPDSDLAIHVSDDECLAQFKDSAACLLTVKKFNDYLRHIDIPKDFPIDSARKHAIREILTNFYLANEARNKQVTGSDSIARDKQNWIQWNENRMKYKKLGIPVMDYNSLLNSYYTYFDAFFRERRTQYYSIIGSSDSLYMDSIAQALKRDLSKSEQIDENQLKIKNQTPDFPWSNSCAMQLPEDFNKYTDTLHLKEVTEIMRMPYGFFIVRLDSVQIRPEVRFEDAQKDLILLATKRKWNKLDSVMAEKAYKIYTSDKHLNQISDTLRIMTFLASGNNRIPISGENKITGNITNKKAIRNQENGRLVFSTQLPFDIRDSLLNRWEAGNGKQRIIGPIRSRFGIWNFKVIGSNAGGGTISFSLVKKRLIDSIAAIEVDFPSDSQGQNPDSLLDNIALAKSYAPYYFGEFDEMKEEQNNPSELNAPLNSSGNAEKENPKLKKEKKRQSRAAELNAWISKISIHLFALSR
jgi:hypothetical protein